jgi:hypothetical protein
MPSGQQLCSKIVQLFVGCSISSGRQLCSTLRCAAFFTSRLLNLFFLLAELIDCVLLISFDQLFVALLSSPPLAQFIFPTRWIDRLRLIRQLCSTLRRATFFTRASHYDFQSSSFFLRYGE